MKKATKLASPYCANDNSVIFMNLRYVWVCIAKENYSIVVLPCERSFHNIGSVWSGSDYILYSERRAVRIPGFHCRNDH